MINEAINYFIEQWKDKFDEIDIQAAITNETQAKVTFKMRIGERQLAHTFRITAQNKREWMISIGGLVKDFYYYLKYPIDDSIPEGYARVKIAELLPKEQKEYEKEN